MYRPGFCPSEAELQEILRDMEDPQQLGSVHMDRYLPVMLKIMAKQKSVMPLIKAKESLWHYSSFQIPARSCRRPPQGLPGVGHQQPRRTHGERAEEILCRAGREVRSRGDGGAEERRRGRLHAHRPLQELCALSSRR